MNYGDYQLEDFLTDASFLNYCLRNNEEDVLFWENWLAANPDRQPIAAQAQQLYALIGKDLATREKYQPELEAFKTLFAEHIQQSSAAPAVTDLQRPLYARIGRWLAAAAVTGTLFLAGRWVYYDYLVKDTTVAVLQPAVPDSIPAKKTFRLPDGTVVVANANSTISLEDGYNVRNRLVQLNGEAFFEVSGNERLPFRVKCGDVITTALGTSFMVRYYQHESGTKVSLVTGKVKVQRAATKAGADVDIAYLDPGQELIVDRKHNNQIKKNEFKIEDAILWQQDLLAFRDARFNEIVTKLEDWYGVKIAVRNMPAVSKHFTGEFRNKSLKNVLEALSFAHKFEYSLTADTIRITFPEN
ncbi:FecR family protein [Chitinophaga nivalis]|uniref:DUF4974 domain-containing protein n=1 Tax=Chitinophaga nivalis TaxID=2991709 RepID=A0ABT3IR27_9BACT|nr:FecR family protein [Chitinophaga nivalis]MCW3463907.1 DUF4974 domain-containing protein [Chitinophaga nivalis]MCW3486403.1 DUF4974 domain-containing protein [Chitinophaga nivalis]